MYFEITAVSVLLVGAALTGYCKLTLVNHFHYEAYLTSPRARRLYWGARAGAVALALAIAAAGYGTHIVFFAVPLYAFAVFAIWVNARALHMRLTGRYRAYYRERGLS